VGTKFRTMLAPIGVSTGDGRRFAEGAIELAPVPFPFEWARSREGGHDGAVSVGVVQETATLSVADALAQGWAEPDDVKGLPKDLVGVWARGEMFDGVDREEMPRLAEDVAEAMHLIGNGTLGPSVDLDSFDAVPVMEGTDEPVTWEDIEAHFEETGEEPKIELLVTAGRVRAATLVSIPAFAETSRPMRLEAADGTPEEAAALVASVGDQTRQLPPVGAFTLPVLHEPTPITWDWDLGLVFGHIATWRTCHVGYAGVCVTPPRDDEAQGYAMFNRHPVDTEDGGTIWAGRLTVGGRHAGLALSASAAMAAYDGKDVAAHVRAYSDEHGIVVAGVIEAGAFAHRAVLERRKVSGDWRETPAGLTLVEVLALSPGPRAHSEPGFPVQTHNRNGRQVALTAALGPEPGAYTAKAGSFGVVDVAALANELERTMAFRAQARAEASAARMELAATVAGQERAALAAAIEGGQ
jgi:hypothetical protein